MDHILVPWVVQNQSVLPEGHQSRRRMSHRKQLLVAHMVVASTAVEVVEANMEPVEEVASMEVAGMVVASTELVLDRALELE